MRESEPCRALFCPHRRTGYLPISGLFRDLPGGSRSLALVSVTLSSSAGRLSKAPRFLLASCADGDPFVRACFVKNRERVLKVRKALTLKCQKVRR